MELLCPLSSRCLDVNPDYIALLRLTATFGRRLLMALSCLACALLFVTQSGAQDKTPSSVPAASASSTSTDLFVMLGSDIDRPGSLPRANYNIGIGHTCGFLKRNPIGDELTFSYTYENSGTHGFFHTDFGEHTETLGVMKNFNIPRTKVVSGYTWVQSGITSYTGNNHALNRMASGASIGAVIHFNDHHSMWLQESYNKVVTVPWYTTSSIGYTYSW